MDELTAVLKARELVNKVAPADIRVSVEAYAKEVSATIRVEYDLQPDESGYCVPGNGKYRIVTNGNEDETRQRFTACHEIAHIVLGLPSEHTAMPSWSYAKRPPNEILCDVFASELLLPYKLFKPLVDKVDISLAAVDELAARAMASNMATGSRFAALVSAPCAFVLSEKGKVRYASRSTMLRQANAWIPPGTVLPQDSLAHRLRAGGASSGPGEVEAEVWFDNWSRGGSLLEDARHLRQRDQTISLLWFEDEEVPSPIQDRHKREEDEFGLAELDGELPWPGKRRRKK